MSLFFRLHRFALCASLVALFGAAHADERNEIERLFHAGDTAAALQRADRAIAAAPRDAQLRFLKAVMLGELNRRAEAEAMYLGLTQDFPELPEPYNNLAVLYAANGELGKAREALELALRNDPSYATAHENLGDVYVRLAVQSYERARGTGADLQRKLQLARQLLLRVGTVSVAPAQP
jgi:Flp pilus assembly protein TadD